VDFQSGINGALAGTTSQSIKYNGSSSPVAAVPASGYHFVNWTGTGGFATTTSNPLTVNNVTASVVLTANFAQNPVNGACGGSDKGTFTMAPTSNLCSSGTASAISGSGPWVWTCAGISGGIDAACSASIQNYIVTFQSSGNGTLTGTASQTINYNGSSSPVTAIPASGYHFVNWAGTGGFATSTSNPLAVNNVTTTQSITASFAINTYSVSFNSNGGTTIPSQSVNYNTTATKPTDPTKTGYTFTGWYTDSGLTVPFAITTAITADTTLYAKWALIPHDGIINPASGKTAPDISDALAVLKHFSGIAQLNASQQIHADVAPLSAGLVPIGDSTVDLADVIIILRRTIGIGNW
jgi:uncharacterized repeat protein (TIGR02543 family)